MGKLWREGLPRKARVGRSYGSKEVRLNAGRWALTPPPMRQISLVRVLSVLPAVACIQSSPVPLKTRVKVGQAGRPLHDKRLLSGLSTCGYKMWLVFSLMCCAVFLP